MTTENFQSMMTDFLKSAQKMQEAFKNANPGAQIDHSKTVEGKAGAGDLTVIATVNLKMQMQSVKFSPTLFEQNQDIAEELVTAAVNAAIKNAQEALQKEMMQISQKMGFPQGSN